MDPHAFKIIKMYQRILVEDDTIKRVKLTTRTSTSDVGVDVEYREDLTNTELIRVARSYLKLAGDKEYIPIFIDKEGFISFISGNKLLKDIDIKNISSVLIQERFVPVKVLLPSNVEECVTVDIEENVSNIVSRLISGPLAPIVPYYTLFSLEGKEPRPLNPKKPLCHCTLAYSSLILRRYIYVFPPRLMSTVDVAWVMFYDCRKYIFDHDDVNIEHSDLVELAVYDFLISDKMSINNGSLEISNHIPARFGASYELRDEVFTFSNALRIKNKDMLTFLKSYVRVARRLQNFGASYYNGNIVSKGYKGNGVACIDPFGLTFYNRNKEKISKRILYNSITELTCMPKSTKVQFYNRTSRCIETIEFQIGINSTTFSMQIINTIEVINKEINASKVENVGIDSKDTIESITAQYKSDYKKLMRRIDLANEVVGKNVSIDDAYENIASFYSAKCEITKKLKVLSEKAAIIDDECRNSGKEAPVLDDLKILKTKLKETNERFIGIRQEMRNNYIAAEDKVQSYNNVSLKIINGVKTIKTRWDKSEQKSLDSEKIVLASRILELLTFYWCEANFLDVLHGNLTKSQQKKVTYQPFQVKNAVLSLQISITLYKQQIENEQGIPRTPLPARLSEPVIIE